MANRTRVLLLFGGRSAEHEVSIVSASFIARSLDPASYEVLLVGIDRDGRWLEFPSGALDGVGSAADACMPAAGRSVMFPPFPSPIGAPRLQRDDGSALHFDVIFPVLHGPLGEDGAIQGLFELADVAYVGSGVSSSAVGMDKVLQKQLLEHAELSVVPYRWFGQGRWQREADACLRDCLELGLPLFVKPANMGSSQGIRRVATEEELAPAIEFALEFDNKVLVEQGLESPREIELAVLGNDTPEVSLPGEIVVHHESGWYSYEAKYIDDGAELCVPARLQPAEVSGLQRLALQTFRTLGCSGLARIDLFVAAGQAYVNEVNTMPGFTAISMYPQLWAASGRAAPQLVHELVELAQQEHAGRTTLRTTRKLDKVEP